MPSLARYTGAIYFGLMMSGALAPPGWGVASATPPAKHAGYDPIKATATKQPCAAPHKTQPSGVNANVAGPATPAPADPPLPDGPDLLR